MLNSQQITENIDPDKTNGRFKELLAIGPISRPPKNTCAMSLLIFDSTSISLLVVFMLVSLLLNYLVK